MSARGRVLAWLLRAAPLGAMASSDALREHVERQTRNPPSFEPPSDVTERLHVTREDSAGYPVYTLVPKGPTARADVVYFHGGAYVVQISPLQWRLAAELADAGSRVIVPVYPLAPTTTAADLVPRMTELLAGLLRQRPTTVVLGYSAGGGLALATAQQLRDQAGIQPRGLLLIAPWLDVSMTHPDQAELERADPVLRREALAEAGRMYAGALPITDPRVSPLRGDQTGLAPISLFVGTRDLLLADSRELRERCQRVATPVRLQDFDGMTHVFAHVRWLPEARTLRRMLRRHLLLSGQP